MEGHAADAESGARPTRPTTCVPGLGWTGLEHLQEFVRKGGLLITANDTANFAVTFGFTPGRQHRARARA